MTYQPQYFKGKVTGRGSRDVEGRYAAMAKHFPGTGFTLFDLGASSGYFPLRAAHEYNAQCVAADPIPALSTTLQEAGDSRVTGVFENLSPEQVRGMGPFDVGVCFSVLHHLPEWREMLKALRAHCALLFVECAVAEEGTDIPDASRAGEIDKAVRAMASEVVCHTPGIGGKVLRPMYLVRKS